MPIVNLCSRMQPYNAPHYQNNTFSLKTNLLVNTTSHFGLNTGITHLVSTGLSILARLS
jgi:hypothetical protein